MRIHLGHHFYGAGNLGDDFMLAGFLGAMRTLAPDASYTACVPFPLEPLTQRFPSIDWRPYDDANRLDCIRACDVWLGLGGSPFQSAQSRWFIDHLVGEQSLCLASGKSMFFLGVGVQTDAELKSAEVRAVCAQSQSIWTRDLDSAHRLAHAIPELRVTAASDLAHLFFSQSPPPRPALRRVTLVANFDYGEWPGMEACLWAINRLNPVERVWLAQESRELPGAEKAIFAAMPEPERSKWQLTAPDSAGTPLKSVLSRWPTGEWLISSRYHAALAGAWSGSKVVVIATNEKLRGVATELGVPSVSPNASVDDFASALAASTPCPPPLAHAERALNACRDFLAAVRAG